LTGEKLPTEIIARRNIDLAIPISNPQKAERELGWKSKISTYDSMKNAYNFLLNKRIKTENTKRERVVHFVPYFDPHSG
jgi:UDP-glucose 4-epimerase